MIDLNNNTINKEGFSERDENLTIYYNNKPSSAAKALLYRKDSVHYNMNYLFENFKLR